MTEQNSTDAFDWAPLGEQWWRDCGRQVRASEQHLRFACAIYRGCSQTEAARQAGYSGGNDKLKGAGYKARRTTAVNTLLALATAEKKPAVGLMDAAEAKLALSDLARGSDPSHRIRAIEAIIKLDAKPSAAAIERDGFSDWRAARDFLQAPNGGAAFVLLWIGTGATLSALPMLHDLRSAVMRDAPYVWEHATTGNTAAERAWLQRLLDNPDWQREARVKLWREIGVTIEGDDVGAENTDVNIASMGDQNSAEMVA